MPVQYFDPDFEEWTALLGGGELDELLQELEGAPDFDIQGPTYEQAASRGRTRNPGQSSSARGSKGGSSKGRKGPICNYWGREGHVESRCWDKQNDAKGSKGGKGTDKAAKGSKGGKGKGRGKRS